MTTTRHVPVEVYLRSSYEPDAEYVDGTIERRPAGRWDHASWQLKSKEAFCYTEKGISFDMNELKNLLD
jgi:hypothetical protein